VQVHPPWARRVAVVTAPVQGYTRLMTRRALFLHLTDPHVSAAGVPFDRDDQKVTIPGIPPSTREPALELMLRRLGQRLAEERRALDGVLFAGDAQNQGKPGGHELVLKLLLNHLGSAGVTADRILAVPGNHDVPRDSAPGSANRYKSFTDVWSAAGCVVPWLDGVDVGPLTPDRHRLSAADRSWAVFAVNTSNWSHIVSEPPEPLKGMWSRIPDAVAAGDTELADKIRAQLQDLVRFDMARVSPEQLEALREIVKATPGPDHGRQLRIAVMHHHLRAPSLREEVKAFADISNLPQLRAFLRGSALDIVLHGHKHEHAAYFDHIYAENGEDVHRTLVISGATYDVGREGDAARLIAIEGLPHTPEVTIEPIPLPRSGAEPTRPELIRRRLWAVRGQAREPITVTPNAPVVIHGSDLDEVYSRALAVARQDARRGTLIVSLDLLDDGGDLPLPSDYAVPGGLAGVARAAWLRELVGWWQLDKSQLEHRIPHLHGARLRRYGGTFDQIARIRRLLSTKASTRAIAVLVDPIRDFKADGIGEEFASFCLVEFRRRDADAGRIVVDAIAFYRAQEMERWWPINVAELRLLQREICAGLGFQPGRITTVAADARTISKSPTQVSMPIIDRWLDQAPERLHLLAEAFVHREDFKVQHAPVVADWRLSLTELNSAAEHYNGDGIPVAIEGLSMLAAYIGASADAEDLGLRSLARDLGDLARLNEGFEASARERADFDRWSLNAKSLIARLEEFTLSRFPSP
jgi:3',5'-cyclic AMP phosphodiesterase CpdA